MLESECPPEVPFTFSRHVGTQQGLQSYLVRFFGDMQSDVKVKWICIGIEGQNERKGADDEKYAHACQLQVKRKLADYRRFPFSGRLTSPEGKDRSECTDLVRSIILQEAFGLLFSYAKESVLLYGVHCRYNGLQHVCFAAKGSVEVVWIIVIPTGHSAQSTRPLSTLFILKEGCTS